MLEVEGVQQVGHDVPGVAVEGVEHGIEADGEPVVGGVHAVDGLVADDVDVAVEAVQELDHLAGGEEQQEQPELAQGVEGIGVERRWSRRRPG